MTETRIKISSFIENQLPEFVRDQFPLATEFLSQYYRSVENQGLPKDILENIDQYIKIDNLTNLVDSTTLSSNISFFDSSINVNSTAGFPKSYGLLKIDDEIVTYTGTEQNYITGICTISIGSTIAYVSGISSTLYKGRPFNIPSLNKSSTIVSVSSTSVTLSNVIVESAQSTGYSKLNSYSFNVTSPQFIGCVRGFSGITSYSGKKDELTFTKTQSQDHIAIKNNEPTKVINLSVLFLKEFLTKIKKQITPGFENRELYSQLNKKLFIKQAKDFYSSKGTDNSFKILFGALYGEPAEVIKPRDYLIEPSNAQYRVTSNLVVESIEGNPERLVNGTLYQDAVKFDDVEFSKSAQGTITKVEKIRRGSKNYYVISLDFDYDKDIKPVGTVLGQFTIHPKTKLVQEVVSGSTTLEVDSTVAFPHKGTLIVNLSNRTNLSINYTSKTLNQFLGCSGIFQNISESTEIKLDTFAYGYSGIGTGSQVKVRVLGVLSDLDISKTNKLYSEGDVIKIKTLGIGLKEQKYNNWFFNIPVKYDVKSIELLDSSDKSYRINTYEDHLFEVGDYVELTSSTGIEYNGNVISFNNEKSFSVQFGSETSLLNTSITYIAKKRISKASVSNYSSVNKYTSNVQNVYYEDEDTFYVASSSLPSYLNRSLNVNDRSISFSGTFSGKVLEIGRHGFYTGDSIVYKPSENNSLGIETGVYFIKKITDTKVKLSRSKDNIYSDLISADDENFVTVNGTVQNARFELSSFTYRDFSTQLLESQKLIRKISKPQNDGNSYETLPGQTGIFINGVELLNYKSNDNVYYGPIQKIVSTSPGEGYDIINPPNLEIFDPIGTGAEAYCSVDGSLERIEIIDPGFDYLEEPKIIITGGNGSGASAKTKLITFEHSSEFNSQNTANLVKLDPVNTIGFSSHHKFRDNEEVVYITNNQKSVGGLSTNSTYIVSVQDAFNVKLYKSVSDSVLGINTIQLSAYGTGNHEFKSVNKKKKIGSIVVENSGKGYQNKLTTVSPVGINTSLDIITISSHGYESGEIITYDATETSIGGLTSSFSYYVTRLNENQFKLSQIGIGTLGITTSFYYDTKQYINLTSTGTGLHKFNYPKIKVQINGIIGVSTLTGQRYDAIVQPVFRGQIQSVFVTSEGSNYGSQEIINYNKQPLFNLNAGSDARLTPIVLDGKIVSVLIRSSGSGYNSPPDIKIIGKGVGAVLTPILSNETISEVKVISGGIGYENTNTSLEVIAAGTGAKFEAKIKPWKINLIERLIQNSTNQNLQILDDDGILTSGINDEYGIQYTHAYAPRYLRRSVKATSFRDGKKIYFPDLQLLDNIEQDSRIHSPIIGWAYDGNPIYGPYGFSSKTGGSVKTVTSGYKKVIKSERPGGPGESLYPHGFFVEDYDYVGDGDLDEHNGRFCITPEYPNGVYAYFTTVNQFTEASGTRIFANYKKPAFPYVIGNTYKSRPIDFNFESSSNQDKVDINQKNWLRNITPYNITSTNDQYDYLFNPNEVKEQDSFVTSISSGSVDSIGIVTGGKNYRVKDKIIFTGVYEKQAKANVSLIKGKKVNSISVASSTFDDVEFLYFNDRFIGFTTVPHNYLNNDLVTITGKYDYKKSGNIAVNNNSLSLTSGVGSASYTGLVTYFNVAGNLSYPNIRENDIYQIGNEQIKILSVDLHSSRILVLRNQNNTVGLTSYSAGIALTERTRKFSISFGISTSYNLNVNKQLYFNPKESLGIGTNSGVGIVSTIYFSNPGAGITQITIPTQSIYIKNHNLNTGDSLIYSSNGGTRISVSTNGTSSFVLGEQSIVYVAKLSNDLIGISTVRVGLGSTGSFVSTGSTLTGLLYLNSVGSGNTHSFKTNYADTLTAQVSKNIVTVSTAETHGLSLLDNVIVKVNSGLTTTFIVKYDDYNRRLLINPKTFSSIDTENNIININNHGYYTGQKVLYTSLTPASGLLNEGLYYVVSVSPNKIKLSNSYYEATKNIPNVIDITSSTSGTISAINPPLTILKNQSVIFDLSDSSLAFTNAGIAYSAFDFKVYKDSNFKNEFDSSETSSTFEVSKIGRIGIDSTAKVILNVNDNVPRDLYYNLVPVNLQLNSRFKKEIISDSEVLGYNSIKIKESIYEGKHSISGISSNTFSYIILENPEVTSYNKNVEYYTDSRNAYGEIERIEITDGGRYSKLPIVSDILSISGYGALLRPDSNSIGKITSIEIKDIGFDYSADYSVRPVANLPTILVVEPASSFDYIGITSFGKNYNRPPNLIVIDGLTNKIITDVKLSYSLGDSKVGIIKNTKSINNVLPKIIPVDNSNGIKISDINFNNVTKDVVVFLQPEFSDVEDFPFEVGGKVLIEGVSVGIASTAKGYNSSAYDYTLFTITEVHPNIGGIGASVSYNLSSHLINGEVPGSFNEFYSYGKIIPESHFPIFNPVLKKNDFYEGETIISNENTSGFIVKWDSDNDYLKVFTSGNFNEGDTILGKTSSSIGTIKNVIGNTAEYKIRSASDSRKGWNKETGFLNNSFQRVHDSDYYQYFSYALKSKVDLSKWDDAVSTLNHTSGFKKFGNLIVESKANLSISTDQNRGDFSSIVDLSSVIDLNCVNDFDLVRENNVLIDNSIKSNEIYFNSRIIQDYIESIGNRVLIIDDISNQFNSNPRPTEFSVADSFVLKDFRSKKYIINFQDKRFLSQSQINLISLIHNDSVGFLNQYGIYTVDYLGFFDFNIFGDRGNLLFYPKKPKYNDYHIKILSFSLSDITTGIGTINLGDVVKINTTTSSIPQGTSSPVSIVGIASTYRSSKVLVQIGATDSSYFEYNEITYIHDDNEVYILDYGKITTNNLSQYSSPGIGTYNAYLSGSNVVIDLVPNSTTTVGYVVNTFNVSTSNTSAVTTGSAQLSANTIFSNTVSIASSSSPNPVAISTYSNLESTGSYSIITIEDTTNSQYQVCEFLTATNSEGSSYIQFADIETGSTVGVVTSATSGSTTNIYFTPVENIDVEVKVFQINLGFSNISAELPLINGSIDYKYNDYTGTSNDVKKQFNLTHKSTPIFERYFDGSSSQIINVEKDTIRIPNHFYSTGEEISYSSPGYGTTQSIGISTTFVVGIGSTDKLPSTLYVVKVNDLDIKVAISASDALKSLPNVLDLNSVGIGNSHVFSSKKPNSKSLISIDNVIQTPVVSTSTTTFLIRDVTPFDSEIQVSDTRSIYGGDLIIIGQEIMKVASVGFGSTNSLNVIRSWLGTGISTNPYPSSTLVTKAFGNYNIINNTIHFAEAPYGKVPITNPLNRPDEVDYVGISTGSSFSGRVFLRSAAENTNQEVYYKNYIFNDISDQFDGNENSFELKSNALSVTGIATDNAIVLINDIFQEPNSIVKSNDYYLRENSGITTITFVGNPESSIYDVNTATIPRGGIIISLGSFEGFGYQPLVAAGGTAIVSSAGTIQSISIGNSGSGYRPGIQKVVNVGVQTESVGTPNIEYIGIASVINGRIVSVSITNPGSGYTSTNPPIVVFDSPLSYSNIPLVYSSKSTQGIGTGAYADIVVGQGSSIISFELKNLGYGYKQNEILTVSIGGTTGIPTNITSSFSEFNVTVDRTQNDKFASWSIGKLRVLDSIEFLFDGNRTRFPLSVAGNRLSIRAKTGSNIDLQATLLVFLNDTLQVPGESYIFNGGSIIKFTEAPNENDKCSIIFYSGTDGVDTKNLDILETIKIGDSVTIKNDNPSLTQDQRLVEDVVSSDTIFTNLYPGPGITRDENLSRSLTWCRQTEDMVVNGQKIGKDRIIYEPYLQPFTYAIQNIGLSSSKLYVESVKSFFDNKKEYFYVDTNESPQNKIIIVSQDALVSASATVTVSIAGTISSINITNGGSGYSTSPSISISNPVGVGTSGLARASAIISEGSISSIGIITGGFGYSSSNPPVVLIEPPSIKYEIIDKVVYEGDFGIITGISTTSVGVASTGIVFDFFIPTDSVLRNSSIVEVGTATTGISGIQTGYYFTIRRSNIGFGVTSLNISGEIVGIGTRFIDNVYQVASVSIGQTSVPGIGVTNVAKVTVSVSGYNNLSGLGFSSFYGEYSWGVISTPVRVNPESFVSYSNVGGISTSPIIQRFNRLKYVGYSTT